MLEYIDSIVSFPQDFLLGFASGLVVPSLLYMATLVKKLLLPTKYIIHMDKPKRPVGRPRKSL